MDDGVYIWLLCLQPLWQTKKRNLECFHQFQFMSPRCLMLCCCCCCSLLLICDLILLLLLFLRWHIIKFMLCWQNDIANAKVLIKNKEIYLVGCCCQLYQFALIPFNFSAVQFNVGKVSFDVLLKKIYMSKWKTLSKVPDSKVCADNEMITTAKKKKNSHFPKVCNYLHFDISILSVYQFKKKKYLPL